MDVEVYTSMSEEETHRIGMEFSMRLHPGDLVACYGELGSGKTEFVKGICRGLNVQEIVSSPTYTIVNLYSGEDEGGHEVEVYHIDLYRIESLGELIEIGFSDIINDPETIKLIEWSENAASMLPPFRYDIRFHSLEEESGRRIEMFHHEAAEVAIDGNHRWTAGG